jgi:hypothetical protein
MGERLRRMTAREVEWLWQHDVSTTEWKTLEPQTLL